MDSNEPCPHCGPLQAEVERLRLEVERVTSERNTAMKIADRWRARLSTLSQNLAHSTDLLERSCNHVDELEQALAEAREKAASDSKGYQRALDAQIRPLYEKRRELIKALRLGEDAHQSMGDTLAVVESAIDALEMVEAEVQRRHVDPEYYSQAKNRHLGGSLDELLCETGERNEVQRMLVEKYRDRIAELERELAEAQSQVVRWVSVEERLPETSGDYLVMCCGEQDVKWCSVYRDGVPRWHSGDYSLSAKESSITHWAPLPKPPEEGTGK